MSELSAEQRQQLKQESARMAITDANISQWFAGAAAVVALISPPHAAVLGLGAAAMGVCGNYRQAVANDPPRDDYQEVSITGAIVDEAAFPEDEPLRTVYRFAAHQIVLTDALYGLLISLERYDGAENNGDFEAVATQVSAIQQNAGRAADLQDNLANLAESIGPIIQSLRQGMGFDSITLEQVQQLYSDSWGRPPGGPGEPLQSLLSGISGLADDLLEPFDFAAAHPILQAESLPEDTDEPLGGTYQQDLREDSETLRLLVS